tara:strand:- start:8 stop:1666 length:1659 start_codon:yes stop_codon:yes gene_type:complete
MSDCDDVLMLLNILKSVGMDMKIISYALSDAISKGNINLVSALIKFGASVDMDMKIISYTLSDAISKGNINLVSTLIKCGADVNISIRTNSKFKSTSMHDSIRYCPNSIMRKLTPMMFIVTHNCKHSMEMMRLLIDYGADVNKQDSIGMTALMYTAMYLSEKDGFPIMKMLIESGVEVDKQDEIGHTALMYQAHHLCSERLIHLLIDAGADPNKQNVEGATALLLSLHSWHHSVPTMKKIRLLVTKENVNKLYYDGSTALMHVNSCGHGAGVIRLLINTGADVNMQDMNGLTALMHIIGRGGYYASGMLRVLLDKGADVNMQDKDGWTALMYAAKFRGEHGTAMMRLLIDAGADVNMQNNNGQTALMIAAKLGCDCNVDIHYAEMIHLLLIKKADINMQNNDGETALMLVILYGGIYLDKIIYMLVNADADIDIKNKNNKTAYDIAVKENNKLAICILEQYKANWIFNSKIDIDSPLKLWSEQNIQSVKDIYTIWRRYEKSGFGKLPWEIIRDIILPMTIDRKDTVKLIKKKKEEEEEKKISSRPCKRAKIH